ncbi:unnamed protein product, partial [Owenia fusiformis]
TGGVSATTPNIHSTYLNYEGCIYTSPNDLSYRRSGDCTETRKFVCEVDSASCPSGNYWILYNNHCYADSNNNGVANEKTFQDAQDYCATDGGHLVTFSDSNEEDYFESIISCSFSECDRWIGQQYVNATADDFAWLDDTTMAWSSWGSLQPNHTGYSDGCVSVDMNGDWFTWTCSESMAYACQKQPEAVTTCTDGPTTEVVTTDGLTTETVTTDGPTTEAVTTDGPTTETVTPDGPTTETVTTDGPTTAAVTTDGPTTETVTTDGPTTAAVTTGGPTTEAVTTDGPTAEAVITVGPTAASVTTYESTAVDFSYSSNRAKGHRLEGHIVEAVYIQRKLQCANACLNNVSCVGYNFAKPKDVTGANCELLDTTIDDASGADLIESSEWSSYQVTHKAMSTLGQ